MKLLKLVYFAHGWYLALTGEPLIDEPVYAWRFGPVIRSLYHEFKRFGRNPISDFALVDEWPTTGRLQWNRVRIDQGPNQEENTRAKQIVRRVWEEYGKLTGVQLSNLTHVEDGPWFRTRGKEIRNTIIPNDAIRTYFQNLATAVR